MKIHGGINCSLKSIQMVLTVTVGVVIIVCHHYVLKAALNSIILIVLFPGINQTVLGGSIFVICRFIAEINY